MDFPSEEPGSIPPLTASEDGEGELRGGGPVWGHRTPEIAHPGDVIEFYGVLWSKEEEESLTRRERLQYALRFPDTRLWDDSNWAYEAVSNVVLGVIPPQDLHRARTISSVGNNLITIPHHFGMLSESGMVLQRLNVKIDERAPGESATKGTHLTNVTRIDVPHTLVTYSIPNWTAVPNGPVPETDPAKSQDAKRIKAPQGKPAPPKLIFADGHLGASKSQEKEAHSPQPEVQDLDIPKRKEHVATKNSVGKRGVVLQNRPRIILISQKEKVPYPQPGGSANGVQDSVAVRKHYVGRENPTPIISQEKAQSPQPGKTSIGPRIKRIAQPPRIKRIAQFSARRNQPNGDPSDEAQEKHVPVTKYDAPVLILKHNAGH